MEEIFLYFMILLNAGQAFNPLGAPDYVSYWRVLRSQIPGEAGAKIKHNLGEVPLLVEVLVKSKENPNMNFKFPATGGSPRDDDVEEQYGGVTYIYNDEAVLVSAPIMKNDYDGGMAIYAANNDYFAGPNNQSTYDVRVRVRAWKGSSLPAPDFSKQGIQVDARSVNASHVYIEETHGFGDYPSLVKVRTELLAGDKVGYFSDAVGANIVTITSDSTSQAGYVVHGFNNHTVRVWVSSNPEGVLFQGSDGWQIPTKATTGHLEIYAWKADTLRPAITTQTQLGPNIVNENFQIALTNNKDDMFIQVWAESLNGSNAGYRFPGSGSLAYANTVQDDTCTYGGLMYGFTFKTLRLWRPTNIINAGIICISNTFGMGINSQREIDAKVVISLWTSEVKKPENKEPGIKGNPEWQEVENKCTHIKL